MHVVPRQWFGHGGGHATSTRLRRPLREVLAADVKTHFVQSGAARRAEAVTLLISILRS